MDTFIELFSEAIERIGEIKTDDKICYFDE